MQSKLLRVFQEKLADRVRGNTPKDIDVMIIAATSNDLVEKKLRILRKLYFRLNIIYIHISPLRERIDDILILCKFFLKRNNDRFGIYIEKISDNAMESFFHKKCKVSRELVISKVNLYHKSKKYI